MWRIDSSPEADAYSSEIGTRRAAHRGNNRRAPLTLLNLRRHLETVLLIQRRKYGFQPWFLPEDPDQERLRV